MATQPEDLTDDEPLDVAEDADEQPREDAGEDQQQDEPPADDEQDEITFGDQSVAPGEEEPEGIRNLRSRLREVERENRELRGGGKPVDIGEKPTLESCDYDEDRYDQEYDAWKERKRQADDAATEEQRLAEAVTEDVEAGRRAFDQQRAALKVQGYDAANDTVIEALPELFLNAVNVAAGQKAAALRFYLGTHPEELAKLKSLNPRKITDLIRLSGEVGRMAEKINVKRKPTTQPETQHRGTSGAGAGNADQKLARLEKEAERSGDRTALIAYRRQLRERERA